MPKKGIILNKKSKQISTSNLELLGQFEKGRNDLNIGYFSNLTKIKIIEPIGYINNQKSGLNKYIENAILEKEEEIIKRAFELEDVEYKKVRKEAEKEARKILNK